MKFRFLAAVLLLATLSLTVQAQSHPRLIEVKHHKAHKATKHKASHHPHKYKAHAT